ncbi:hypothetical protein PLESTM_000080900 [Pleodorina starrii]|nr:hypothetical protein PLESTM_000080900 [Pleodorina starrii]
MRPRVPHTRPVPQTTPTALHAQLAIHSAASGIVRRGGCHADAHHGVGYPGASQHRNPTSNTARLPFSRPRSCPPKVTLAARLIPLVVSIYCMPSRSVTARRCASSPSTSAILATEGPRFWSPSYDRFWRTEGNQNGNVAWQVSRSARRTNGRMGGATAVGVTERRVMKTATLVDSMLESMETTAGADSKS